MNRKDFLKTSGMLVLGGIVSGCEPKGSVKVTNDAQSSKRAGWTFGVIKSLQ